MAHVRDVKRLYLSGNPLPSSFPSEKFFNLVYLELAMCQLTSLPADFASVVPTSGSSTSTTTLSGTCRHSQGSRGSTS